MSLPENPHAELLDHRQTISDKNCPACLNSPIPFPTRDTLSKEQFDNMMAKGLAQAKSNIGFDLDP